MRNKDKEFPFLDCIIPADTCSVLQALDSLKSDGGNSCVLFDLLKFEYMLQKIGEEKIIDCYLSPREQEHWGRLTLAKRKREWLGGRFAARYVAANMLNREGNAMDWSTLAIDADNNGRPFLVTADKKIILPDISITHSADLAAAMAASQGLCGIDIQKIKTGIKRVRARFCSTQEEQILHTFFSADSVQQLAGLTKLWAAKEAIRKVENKRVLPGFLELELREIREIFPQKETVAFRFIFTRKHDSRNKDGTTKKYGVFLSRIADYILAQTPAVANVA